MANRRISTKGVSVNGSPLIPPLYPFHFPILSLRGELNFNCEKAQDLINKCKERNGNSPILIWDEKAPLSDISPSFDHSTSSNSNSIQSSDVAIFEMKENYDINSGILESFCSKNPISLIRGVFEAFNLNHSLFSLDSILECAPNERVTLRIQPRPANDKNVDSEGKTTWRLESKSSSKRLDMHIKSMKDEEKREIAENIETRNGLGKKSLKEENEEVKRKKAKKTDYVEFGVDFPVTTGIFVDQLKELEKLPSWLQLNHEGDILSYLGFEIPGLNVPYFYLKSRGVRTSAHTEDAEIPSINIGFGPGTSKWFAVPYEFTEKVEEMALKKGLRFGLDPIWPDKEELENANIPVTTFIQKKGEMVYTAAGTLHWVEGQGVGVNMAWNAGDPSPELLTKAIRQYEKTRSSEGLRSSVPMVFLAWRLAVMKTRLDKKAHSLVRDILIRSLWYVQLMEDWILESGGKINDMKEINENTKSDICNLCSNEVFNIWFATEKNKKLVVCVHCMQLNGGFKKYTAFRQRSIEELAQIFDRFNL